LIATPTFTERFSTLAGGYDVVLSDVWGVIHNGIAATVAACDALTRFRGQGGTVVLVTDRWLSPIAGTADAVLSCEVDAPSAYDSLVPAMAVVETVVAGVLAARGDEARARMAACEQVARAADLLD